MTNKLYDHSPILSIIFVETIDFVYIFILNLELNYPLFVDSLFISLGFIFIVCGFSEL